MQSVPIISGPLPEQISLPNGSFPSLVPEPRQRCAGHLIFLMASEHRPILGPSSELSPVCLYSLVMAPLLGYSPLPWHCPQVPSSAWGLPCPEQPS